MAKIQADTNSVQSSLNELLYKINSGGGKGAITDYLRAHAIGWAAGYRSTAPFAALAWTMHGINTEQPAHLLDAPAARTVTALAFGGEAIADKLPGIPSRLKPPVFIERLITGGLAGVILAQRSRRSAVVGALLGGTGAALGSVAGYYSREILDQKTPVPDTVWALLEDVLALGLALMAAWS